MVIVFYPLQLHNDPVVFGFGKNIVFEVNIAHLGRKTFFSFNLLYFDIYANNILYKAGKYLNIGEGDQFGSGFVEINPNSKIPALLDRTTDPATRVFESGAILVYLAEKFGEFIPTDGAARAECLSWLFWQMGSAPYLGGGFGHFYAYAPFKSEYAIDRFTMEVKRQLDVLDRNLAERQYLSGDEYNIADMAVFPWYGGLVLSNIYDAQEFLDVTSYKNVNRWAAEIAARPAVQRGRRVNKTWGDEKHQVRERHSAADIDATFAD